MPSRFTRKPADQRQSKAEPSEPNDCENHKGWHLFVHPKTCSVLIPLIYNNQLLSGVVVAILQGYYMVYGCYIQSNDDDVHCYMLQQKMPAPNLGRSPSLQRRSSPLNIMTSLCPVMRRSYPQNHVKSPEKKQTRQVKWLPFAVLDDFVFDLKLPFRLMEMMHFQSETLSEKEG